MSRPKLWKNRAEDEQKAIRKEMIRLAEQQIKADYPDRYRRHSAARMLVDTAIAREAAKGAK